MTSRSSIRAILESDALLERLAAVEHERWAHWQRYVHEQCLLAEDGSLVIPRDLVERWSTQIATPYADLSEEEQESDRDQVRRYLPLIVKAVTGGEAPE
ncbi:hypothetical protein [Georgenia daeguensis]|uniref:Uncharacterized protein n=1 Tax=Georgenia daeguensis TaxID=908355 RepID=A0ABP6US68_9MICO